jgi:hypothetical protein
MDGRLDGWMLNFEFSDGPKQQQPTAPRTQSLATAGFPCGRFECGLSFVTEAGSAGRGGGEVVVVIGRGFCMGRCTHDAD